MEEDTVIGLPRPAGTVEDNPLLAVLRERAGQMPTYDRATRTGAGRMRDGLPKMDPQAPRDSLRRTSMRGLPVDYLDRPTPDISREKVHRPRNRG